MVPVEGSIAFRMFYDIKALKNRKGMPVAKFVIMQCGVNF